METISKDKILASSSGWVATLLNFFPGLGAGYLYQRRWIPYFLTSFIVTSWLIAGVLFTSGETEPSETQRLIGIGGLFLISAITMIESNIAYRKSLQKIKEDINAKEQQQNRRRSFWWR